MARAATVRATSGSIAYFRPIELFVLRKKFPLSLYICPVHLRTEVKFFVQKRRKDPLSCWNFFNGREVLPMGFITEMFEQ
jgi:hypothetical protein